MEDNGSWLEEPAPKTNHFRLWMCAWEMPGRTARLRFSLVRWGHDRKQIELEKSTFEAFSNDRDLNRRIGYIVGPAQHDCTVTNDKTSCLMCLESAQIPFF